MPDFTTLVDLSPAITVAAAVLTLAIGWHVGRIIYRMVKKSANEGSV